MSVFKKTSFFSKKIRVSNLFRLFRLWHTRFLFDLNASAGVSYFYSAKRISNVSYRSCFL